MTSEGSDTGSEPSPPSSPRRFGHLPELGVPDGFDEPLPEDDWPFDDPSVDVARLRESLAEANGGEEIRARYGLQRPDIGRGEQETAYLLRSPENARRLMEAVARDKQTASSSPETHGTGSSWCRSAQ